MNLKLFLFTLVTITATPSVFATYAEKVTPQEQEARKLALANSKRKHIYCDVSIGNGVWQRPNGTKYFKQDDFSKSIEFTFNPETNSYVAPTLVFDKKTKTWQTPEGNTVATENTTTTVEQPNIIAGSTTESILTTPVVTQAPTNGNAADVATEKPVATNTNNEPKQPEEKSKTLDTSKPQELEDTKNSAPEKNKEAVTTSFTDTIFNYKGSIITAATLPVILRQAWITFCATRTNVVETKTEKIKEFTKQTAHLILKAIKHPLISAEEQKALTLAVWTFIIGNSGCLIARAI